MSVSNSIITRASGLGPFMKLCAVVGDGVLGRVLKKEGVPRHLVVNPAAILPLPAMYGLLDRAAEMAGDELFGFRLGQAMQPSDFGPWIRYVLGGRTLHEMLHRVARSLKYHQPGGRIDLVRTNGHLIFRYVTPYEGVRGRNIHADHIIYPTLQAIRHYAGADWRPDWLEVSYERPSYWRKLEDEVRTAVRYERPCVGIPIPVALLSAPASSIPAGAHYMTLSNLKEIVRARPPVETVEIIYNLIGSDADQTNVSIEAIAKLLDKSHRTIQRDLQMQGVKYREIVSHKRRREAERLLSESDLSIAEIGLHLGYAEPAHFSRAFRKATGMTPSAYRNFSD